MAILEIKKFNEPVLRKKCLPVQIRPLSERERDWSGEEVEEIDEKTKQLINDMAETMKKNQGIGLAAPQVGVSKRVIIAETENGPKAFINPKILKKSREKTIIEEGCLSFPGLFLKIKRPKEVEIQAWDGNGNKIKAKGILARILQHEIDHLDGILFIDRISFWQKIKIRKKLKKLKQKYGSNR